VTPASGIRIGRIFGSRSTCIRAGSYFALITLSLRTQFTASTLVESRAALDAWSYHELLSLVL